ncbi:15253_t:CDS:1, partial [Funneliformis geosporum]
MSTISVKEIDSEDIFDGVEWLEKAISENYIKYYDYEKFSNWKDISSCSNGNVS